jgi:hypothetical protein
MIIVNRVAKHLDRIYEQNQIELSVTTEPHSGIPGLQQEGCQINRDESNRVGGGVAPAVLPHRRTYGSVYGGSC